MAKELSDQKKLVLTIADKMKEMGYTEPEELISLLGNATLQILKLTGEFAGCQMKDMVESYCNALLGAVEE